MESVKDAAQSGPVKYLLDTCAIPELVRKKPSKKVVQWIQGCDEGAINLSVLTISEIQKGITKLADSKRKTKIQQWLDHDLHKQFSGRIIPITEEVANTWAWSWRKLKPGENPLPVLLALLWRPLLHTT